MFKLKVSLIGLLAVVMMTAAAGRTFADFTVQAGETYTLSAGETLTVDGNLTIAATGALDASAGGTTINISGDWTNSGTFTPGDGTVVFNGAGTSVVNGSNTFYNFTGETAGKQINFEAGSTQTITNTLTLNGQASGTEVKLRSSVAGTRWTFDVSGSAQSVEYVDVQDANASSNNIVVTNSVNSGNNDDTEAAPHWVFGSSAAITSPMDAKIMPRQPTIMGTSGPGDTVEIYALVGAASTKVAEVTVDVNGNFRVMQSDFTAQLDIGANSLTPRVAGLDGSAVSITVVASPTTNQHPTITSPADGVSVKGATPTITGKGLAGQSVSIKAKDANGSLLLQEVGSGTVDASGNYSIALTTTLPKGENHLSAAVDGMDSDVHTITLTDPFGVVFDSVSNNLIQGATVTIFTSAGAQATPGVEIGAGDANPQTTAADGAYSFLTIDGDFYITVSASGYSYPSAKTSFPSGRTIVPGSKGETFTVAGVVIEMDHPLDAAANLLKIVKDANKKEVAVGDIVTYTVTIENIYSADVTDVYLEDKIPAGFKYLSGKVRLDGAAISDPTGNRPLTFNIGTISAGTTRTLKYQLVVGSGVTFGNYENSAQARYSGGAVISNTATETVKVVPDSLFDLGTVMGKVFHDKNKNGIQNKGEEPVGNAQIVTEEGTVITTDKDGKYHLAGIIPGRHLFRLDERTLPEGAYLTTDKVVIADITPGILAKVNFGVKLPEGAEIQSAPFTIMQDRGIPQPRLNAALFNKEFRIFTNYHLFIRKWKLEILDQDTKRVFKKFKGTKNNIFDPIYWDPEPLTTNRNYVYRLTVIGAGGRKDTTRERDINPVGEGIACARLGTSSREKDKTEKEKEAEYKKWLEEESRINNLEQQTIKIEGETIKVIPLRAQASYQPSVTSIQIIKSGKVQAEIPIVESGGLTVKDLLEAPGIEAQDSQSKTEIILPGGEYEIGGKSIKVGDDYLFFVAMGDTKMGYTVTRGNIEPVQQDDKFNTGFWSEGKLAYYLNGKIKGKYLITSSFDSDRDKKELFKNLDPDKYYPVYGDSSSIDYKAADTQGALYLLIEWDKSSAIWGNYNTAFTDTEFAQFSRTLYGGKVHLESASQTKFGAPQTKLVVFRARAQQKAAHNEFTGTGGSLYYLKHKDIVEGSDKVKVEVRDKITGLVLATEEMKESSDYEIDYSNGRIIFWESISFITGSSSIISSRLLDGNPVYVVVDYEYEVKDKYDQGTVGARLQQSLNDYLIVGGTCVKEEQTGGNYELQGVDTTLYLGKGMKLTAEYAESESESLGSFISTDGGLSFTELPTAEFSQGKAYGLKGEANLFNNKLGLSSYYKWLDNNFSTSATSSQQGKELVGAGLTYDFTSKTRLTASHDIQKLIDDGNLQTRLQVGAAKTETTTAQIAHRAERLKLTGEYRHQEVTERKNQFESETNTEEDIIAVKADYKLTPKIDLSIEQQATVKGAGDQKTTAGIITRVFDWLSLRGKQTVGTQGTATSIGAISSVKDKFKISGDYTRTASKIGEVGDTASLGASAKVDDKTEVHTAYAVTDSMSKDKTSTLTFGSKRKINDWLEATANRTFASSKDKKIYSNILGLSGDINDKWAASGTFERGIVHNHDGTQDRRHAGSLGLGFLDKDEKTGEVQLKASSKVELRLDQGQQDKRQYLLYNAIEGKINPNTTLFAKANFSQTKNTTTDSTEAQFKEFVFGTAYRPVKFDRLNLLAKYTYLEDNSPRSQSVINDIEKEKAHVLAGEAVMDLTDKWQLSEKLAYKIGEEKVTGFEFTKTSTWLWINRLDYNIYRDWQVIGEYRVLTQKQAEDRKQGALVEVARKIGDFIQVGVGYNFTNFDDDLTSLDYTAHGPFIRITGKFYDRTPKEIERASKDIAKQRQIKKLP